MKNNKSLINISLIICFLAVFHSFLNDSTTVLFAARSKSLLGAEYRESRRERLKKAKEEGISSVLLADRLQEFEKDDKVFVSDLKSDLRQTYQQAEKISRETQRAQAELQRIEKEKVDKARQEYEKLMLKLRRSFEGKLDDINRKSDYLSRKLTQESRRRQDIVMEKAQAEAVLKLNKRETDLLRMNARKKQQDELSQLFGPIIEPNYSEPNCDVEKWRKEVYSDVKDNIDYLSPIFRVDPEFSNLFMQKMNFIENKITMTQSIGDTHYKVVEKELDLINVISDAQKKADAILESALSTMDIDAKRKDEIRFVIMQELTPMVEDIVSSENKISFDEIKKVVFSAVANASYKRPSCEEILEPDLITVKEKLEYELKKQKENSAKIIRNLKKALDDLNKEKINLKVEAEKAKNEFFTYKKLNDKKLEGAKKRFSSLKSNLDEKSKKCIELSVLMKKYQAELSASEMDKKEKDEKLAELENYLNETTVNYLQARVDSQRASYLEESLEETQKEIIRLRNDKSDSRKKLNQKEEEVKKLKDDISTEKRLHEFRKNLIADERNKINREKAEIQEKLSEVAKLKSNMERMAREHKKEVDDLVRQQIEREMELMKNTLSDKQSDVDVQKSKMYKTQSALEKAYEELDRDFEEMDEMVRRATSEMGAAKKIEIESDIQEEKTREEINSQLNKMMNEFRGPIRTQIRVAPSEESLKQNKKFKRHLDPKTSVIHNLPAPKW